MSGLEFLIKNQVVKRQVVEGDQERFHLMKYWIAEESIRRSLKRVLTEQEMVLDVDLQDERFARIKSDPKQMAAARSILTKPIVIISGRGGTGKTEVVCAVLKAAEEVRSPSNIDPVSKASVEDKPAGKNEKEDSMNGPILYCAPTGKAASVISKRVGSKAFTIHQIICSYKVWRQGEMKSPWKFSQVQIIAVDECSMVATEIFHWLLGNLQLPSVDPGNFMEDLFNALGEVSMTATL